MTLVWTLLALFVPPALFGIGCLIADLLEAPSRHERCLANIRRLEREMFPEWFPEAPANHKREIEQRLFYPGAQWIVERETANFIQVTSAPW